MARKSKMNQERRDGIVQMLKNGHTISYACETMKIGRQTEWEERQRNPEYRKAVEAALMGRAEMVEDALYAKALSGDVAAQRLFLINRAPQRWKSEHWAGINAEVGEGGGVRLRLKEMVIELSDNVVDAEEDDAPKLEKPGEADEGS